jgi:hypothetical protein
MRPASGIEEPMVVPAGTTSLPAQAAAIARRFERLAGSSENASALVQALHAGAPVRLTEPREGSASTLPEVAVFKSPTGRLEWEHVRISLGLTQDALMRAGVPNPSIAQLQAALIGGEFVRPDGQSIAMRGVLQMRADGLAWEHIARAAAWKVLR